MKQKILHLAATLAALLTLRPRGVVLANIAEGQHLASQCITLEADVAITERNLLMKRGGAANRVAICGAADTPIGVCSDEAAAAGDIVNMRTFHSDLTIPVVASGAIGQDALLEPSANGRVQTLGAGVGTHHVVGRAMNAAANAGDIIEIVPNYFLRVTMKPPMALRSHSRKLAVWVTYGSLIGLIVFISNNAEHLS